MDDSRVHDPGDSSPSTSRLSIPSRAIAARPAHVATGRVHATAVVIASGPVRGHADTVLRWLHESARRFGSFASGDPWIVHYLIFACYLCVYSISPAYLKATYFREMLYRTSVLTILQTTVNVHRGYDRFDQLRMLGLVLIALCFKDMYRAVAFSLCAHMTDAGSCSNWWTSSSSSAHASRPQPDAGGHKSPALSWLLIATALLTALELSLLVCIAISRRVRVIRRIFALWTVVAIVETGMSAMRFANRVTRTRVVMAVPIW